MEIYQPVGGGGPVMPYVNQVFEGMENSVRACIVQASRDNEYEVQLGGDQVLVNLDERTCTCYKWDLTGIPCVHAYASLLDKRANPLDYVHTAYSKDTYMQAYALPVKGMPGPKHWDTSDLPQPLPPAVRVMPGRPKSTKRKKEKGEGEGNGKSKKQKVPHPDRAKRQNKCGNCGQFGHNKRKCKNGAVETSSASAPKNKGGRPPLNNEWVVEQRKKKWSKLEHNVSFVAFSFVILHYNICFVHVVLSKSYPITADSRFNHSS